MAKLAPSKEKDVGVKRHGPLLGYTKKYKLSLIFAAELFVFLLLSINFHADGSSVTPGNYNIYSSYFSSGILGYDVNDPHQAFIVEKGQDETSMPTNFTLIFLADQQYFITDDTGNRLTQQDDKLFMAGPSPEEINNQLWEIRRWKGKPYFIITNVKSGLSLYAKETGPLQCDTYATDARQFLFGFTPSPE